MIDTPTVFILGAGASKPYGYPTGSELRRQICDANGFYQYFQGKINQRGDDFHLKEPLLGEAKLLKDRFSKSSTSSIDLFLSRNKDLELIGKMAITLMILKAEANSKFREQIEKQEHDWYSYLFNRMTETIKKDDDFKLFSQNEVSFITFNYDRSLEHFLFESYVSAFSAIHKKPKKDIMKKTPIIHVYGKINDLDWESTNGSEYKTIITYDYVDQIKDNIRVVGEREDHDIADITKIIQNARQIFFLGFGYLKENLEIIKIPEILRANQKIFGTAFGFYNEEIERVTKSLSKISSRQKSGGVHKQNVHIEACDCLELLRKHL